MALGTFSAYECNSVFQRKFINQWIDLPFSVLTKAAASSSLIPDWLENWFSPGAFSMLRPSNFSGRSQICHKRLVNCECSWQFELKLKALDVTAEIVRRLTFIHLVLRLKWRWLDVKRLWTTWVKDPRVIRTFVSNFDGLDAWLPWSWSDCPKGLNDKWFVDCPVSPRLINFYADPIYLPQQFNNRTLNPFMATFDISKEHETTSHDGELRSGMKEKGPRMLRALNVEHKTI